MRGGGVIACGVLIIFGAARPSASQTQCAPERPLHAHVIIDNSTSVKTSSRDYGGEISRWLRSLGQTLRPQDRIYVSPLLKDSTGPIQILDTIVVHEASGQSSAAQVDIDALVRQLRQGDVEASDLSHVLQLLRLSSSPSGESCRIHLLLTDGALAPLARASFRNDEYDKLAQEVIAWGRANMHLIAIGFHANDWPGFDSTYVWSGNKDWNPRGFDILRRSFRDRLVPEHNDQEALAELIYFHPASPLMSMRRAPRGNPPQFFDAPYVIYVIRNDSAPEHAFASCAPMARDSNHSTSRLGNGCIHHLRGVPREKIPRGIENMGGEWRWTTNSQLIADGTPDPLLSLGQILVTDTRADRDSPGCTSRFARSMLDQHGWYADPGSLSLQAIVTDIDDSTAVDIVRLKKMPGTSCYGVVDLNSLPTNTAGARAVKMFFDFENSGPPSNANERVFRRDPGQPLHTSITSRRLLGVGAWKSSLDLWFVSGYVALPPDIRRPRMLMADTWVSLEEATDSISCGIDRKARPHVCYWVAGLLNHPAPARSSLLVSEGEAAKLAPIPVPVHRSTLWNGNWFVLPIGHLGFAAFLSLFGPGLMLFGKWRKWRYFQSLSSLFLSDRPRLFYFWSYLVAAFCIFPLVECWYVAGVVPGPDYLILAAVIKSAIYLLCSLCVSTIVFLLPGGDG